MPRLIALDTSKVLLKILSRFGAPKSAMDVLEAIRRKQDDEQVRLYVFSPSKDRWTWFCPRFWEDLAELRDNRFITVSGGDDHVISVTPWGRSASDLFKVSKEMEKLMAVEQV